MWKRRQKKSAFPHCDFIKCCISEHCDIVAWIRPAVSSKRMTVVKSIRNCGDAYGVIAKVLAAVLSDIACDKLHSALRGEGHTLGSGWDENRLALMKSKSMVFILMISEGAAALDAHHDKE